MYINNLNSLSFSGRLSGYTGDQAFIPSETLLHLSRLHSIYITSSLNPISLTLPQKSHTSTNYNKDPTPLPITMLFSPICFVTAHLITIPLPALPLTTSTELQILLSRPGNTSSQNIRTTMISVGSKAPFFFFFFFFKLTSICNPLGYDRL